MFESDAYAVLNRYGFPNLTIKCIPPDERGDYDYEREAISMEIKHWLTKCHAGHLPYLKCDGYEVLEPWWSGIEAAATDWEGVDRFAEALPDEHRRRATTWAEVLKEAGWAISDEWLVDQKFGLRAAILCEWLNGFDQVVENNTNGFSYAAAQEGFGLDDNYITYLAGKIPEDNMNAINFDEIIDADDFTYHALKAIIAHRRKPPADLLGYFGGPGLLAAVLWFCIWPDYKSNMDEAMGVLFPHAQLDSALEGKPAPLFNIINDDVERMLRALELVEDGWSDWADER